MLGFNFYNYYFFVTTMSGAYTLYENKACTRAFWPII